MPDSHPRLRILNLCKWYPNRYDPMPGLFIQRHAEAAALYADVCVVYTHLVIGQRLKQTFEIDFEEKNGVRAAKVYYQAPRKKIPFWSQMVKNWRFLKANKLGIKAVSESAGNFDLVHVHVLTRLGIIALYFKWRYGIPFVITEHWTRYLNLTQRFTGFSRKITTKIVVKQAAVVTTVSDDLKKAMQLHGLKNKDYRVIYNVVDPIFFDIPLPVKDETIKEFVHVSCFTDEQKNISGLLRVVHALSEQRSDFHFTFVGEGVDFLKMQEYAMLLKISNANFTFTGLLEGKPLVETMANADALVLFSNYENMPVVINESFVLGVPVFSTDVGGISEMINNSNGCLVKARDEQGLVLVIHDFLDGRLSFDPDKIRQDASSRFSKEAVGNDIMEIYRNALKGNSQ